MASDDEPLWLTEVYAMFKGARKRDYLVLDEGASPTQRREKERGEEKKKKTNFLTTTTPAVLQIQPSRENPIDLGHLGILLVLDKQRNGRFYRTELIEFQKVRAKRRAR